MGEAPRDDPTGAGDAWQGGQDRLGSEMSESQVMPRCQTWDILRQDQTRAWSSNSRNTLFCRRKHDIEGLLS